MRDPKHPVAGSGNGETAGPPWPDRHMSADGLSAALVRFELGLMRMHEAFSSWALELQKHVSGYQMSFQEAALLHCVRLRGGTTTHAEMLIFLHRHDLAAVNYSLRKLEQLGLIVRKRGPYRREVAYAITDHGREITDVYSRFRQRVLVERCRAIPGMQQTANEVAAVIERMIGIYDQATQSIMNQPLIAEAGAPEAIKEQRPASARARAEAPSERKPRAAPRRD
jgi:predicted MarR family transcription regulator